MFRRLSPLALVVSIVAFSLVTSPLTSQAQEGNKARLAHMVHVDHAGFPQAADASVVVDRLFTLNLAPDVWQTVLQPDGGNDTPRHNLSLLAATLIKVAQNMGWGNLDNLGSDPGNPLRISMVDGWKSKLGVTIDVPAGLNAKASEQAWKNINYLLSPIEEVYYNKPRSGKFLLAITVDPKAPKLGFNLSKDATTFHFVVPAYTDISQDAVRTFLQQGK